MRLLLMMVLAGVSWATAETLFSTYLGGREYDIVNAAALDAQGNVYVAGQTFSRDFPTAGPDRTSCMIGSLGSCSDAFIAKIAPNGSGFVYSKYFGTADIDEATGLAVTPDGTTWVAGNSGNSIFLLKLRSDGREEFVRRIPGSRPVRSEALALDRYGNVYLTGLTLATLPLVRPLQDRPGAPSCIAAGDTTGQPLDAFVMKFSPTGELLYSTYFGGGGNDAATAIGTDTAGNIYVAGNTSSRDLALVKPVQETYRGGEPVGAGQCAGGDGFLAKISADGSELLYSTYSGTAAREEISAIDVSPEGYVTAMRSGPSGVLQTFSPEGELLWEKPVASSTSVARDRAGRIYLAIAGGYMLFDPDGEQVKLPMQGSALQSWVVQPSDSGTVLLGGEVRAPGALQLVNSVQSAHGGVVDGGAILLRPPPEGCETAVLVNSASYRGPYVAPQSLATLFGCDLDSATDIRITDVAGASADAQVVAKSATQINLVLPGGLGSGPLTVAIKKGQEDVAVSEAQLETVAPSLFTADSTGAGPAAAIVMRVAPDGTSTNTPVATCGEQGCKPAAIDLGGAENRNYLLLFGTGIRHAGTSVVSVRANGRELPLLGYAAQSEYAGLDQVNVELPHTLAGAGNVELQLAVGGKLANPVTILIQ